jgi:hypothetical protein
MSLLVGLTAPALIAMALVWLLRRTLPGKTEDRGLFASAAAAGVFLGYVLLPDWAALRPERYWQWLPYVGVAAAAVSALAASSRTLLAVRWLLLSAAALVAAWKLVPDWEGLVPPRALSIVLLAAGMVLLSAALEALPDRLCGPPLIAILALVASGAMVAVAVAVSVKFGQLAGLIASALAGCGLSCLRRPNVSPDAVRGLIPPAVLLLAGVAYVGCIEPNPPVVALLFIPAVPLALWAFAAGPLSRLQGNAAMAAQIGTVAILVAIAVAIACIPSPEPAW